MPQNELGLPESITTSPYLVHLKVKVIILCSVVILLITLYIKVKVIILCGDATNTFTSLDALEMRLERKYLSGADSGGIEACRSYGLASFLSDGSC